MRQGRQDSQERQEETYKMISLAPLTFLAQKSGVPRKTVYVSTVILHTINLFTTFPYTSVSR